MPTYPIVGAHFRPPAKAILAFLPADAPLKLRREASNQFDPNAIAVWVPTSSIPDSCSEALDAEAQLYGSDIGQIMMEKEWQLGYIPAKGGADAMAPLWDQVGMSSQPASLTFNAIGAPRVSIEGPFAGPGMGSGKL